MTNTLLISSILESPAETVSTPSDEVQCYEENVKSNVFGAIIVVLVVVGLVGNSLVFLTITVLREYKKSVTTWYILQLTIADTLFLLMLPFTADSEFRGKWNFSEGLCKFKEAVLFINYYASIYFLVVMSFDRYLAVTKAAFSSNNWVTNLRSPNASYVISIAGWILSVLLCIQLYYYSKIDNCLICKYEFPKSNLVEDSFPSFNEYENFENETELEQYIIDKFGIELGPEEIKYFGNLGNSTDNVQMCKLPNSKELHIWIYGNFIGAFVLPFMFICFFYGMMLKTITTASSSVRDNQKQRAYRRRVSLIVLALVTLFVVSWLPWYVDKLVKINGINLTENQCKAMSDSVRAIAYLNSAFNPYFYSYFGINFWDRLKRARDVIFTTLFCCKAR